MLEEADDTLWSALQAAERASGEVVQFVDRSWQGVLHGPLDPGIALLLGVQFWGVSRQVGGREVRRVRDEEGGRRARAMGVEPVPDHEQRRANLSTEVAQGQDHRSARDA